MSEERRKTLMADERRLVAIMFTDVVGYSARVQRDERTTLALVKADFAHIAELVAQRGGEVLDTMGDGMLLCFPSAVQAVGCALQIQADFNARRERKTADEALEHRIGIHVGDVVRQDGQVAGDGANIAARLQTKAPAGGICVSQMVRDTIVGKLSFHEEFLGPQNLKNIAVKVAAYSLTPPGPQVSAVAKGPGMRTGLIIGLTVGVLAFAVVAWQWPGVRHAPIRAGGPGRSIAVLPFVNMSDDKENAYFADGVHEDILTNLAPIRTLHVVSRTSVMQYRDSRLSMRQLGEQLNVDYILEGSVRGRGSKVRVTMQLIDARTDEHLWAKSFDRDLSDIFATQSELSKQVAVELAAAITAPTP
jgi:adenylate cyclase